MATATASLFTESPQAQIDDLLMRICVELQLDATRFGQAETSYQAVGAWLETQQIVAQLKPNIYPQGSIRLGTTVKPLVGDEYDVDLVCQFACQTTSFSRPQQALDIVERALRANNTYNSMVERKNRCIRLKYAHKFHLDVLPACRDLTKGGTCILVPDRKLSAWTASNPEGFGKWFDGRSREALRILLEKRAPIPAQEQAEQKPPLKLSVQLWKRWRDVRYKSAPELAPISIVLTTLAGHFYQGEASIGIALGSILAKTGEVVGRSFPRLIVQNPTNKDEDLSERWDSNPSAYREFTTAVLEFDSQWKALAQTRGIDKIAKALERLFGEEIAKRVVESQTREIESARSRSQLGISKGSGIISGAAASSVIRVPRNTFYGGKK